MKRIRIVGLCLTALFAFGAIGAVAASAHEYSAIGAVTGTSGISKLEGEVAGAKIVIECSKDTFTGTLEAAGKSSGTVTFEGCKVVGQGTCGVPNIKFKFRDLLVGPEPGVEDEFKPEAGTLFVEIEITTCTLKGKYKVEGTQVCKLPGGEALAKEHTIECIPSGSKLTLGGKEAKFTSTEKVKLVSGAEWRAK